MIPVTPLLFDRKMFFLLAEIFSTVFFQKAEIITVAAHFFPTLFVLPPGADGSVACSVGLA